ncbi:ATP-dependent RNA helicase A [Perkinsus chesapeaki]|uniref:RNA helicase n=1 Tax=Perkinsus chesapeaki TaxID=330153 RepID=A0A7J6LPK5_PERCH|nr:ATP-dependent RNA helicase A [Perkinsus chesapeaki]
MIITSTPPPPQVAASEALPLSTLSRGGSPSGAVYIQGRPRKELYEYCQKKGYKLDIECTRTVPTAPWVCHAGITAIGVNAEGEGANKAKASDEACMVMLRLLAKDDPSLTDVASGGKKGKGKKSKDVDTEALEWYERSDNETPPTSSSPGGTAKAAVSVFRDGPAGYNSDNAKAAVFEWLKRHKMPLDFVYRPVDPKQPSLAGWIASYNHPVPSAGIRLQFTEKASSKKTASQYLALDMCALLFEKGLMPPYTGKSVTMSNGVTNQVQRTAENAVPKPADLPRPIVDDIFSSLRKWGIELPPPPPENERYVQLMPCLKVEPSPFVRGPDVDTIQWQEPNGTYDPWKQMEATPTESGVVINSKAKAERAARIEYLDSHAFRTPLPVDQVRRRVLDMTDQNQVILISGATGSGKTTQIPQFILDHYIMNDRATSCNVIVTQPRRIAAISVASRVAAERGETVGAGTVGYSVRFDTRNPQQPYGSVQYCTTGTLLRRLSRGLKGISHIVVDEIHERDLQTDFLLAILRSHVVGRTGIRIILMSATADVARFTQYFNLTPEAQTLHIKRQQHKIHTYYLEDVCELINYDPRSRCTRASCSSIGDSMYRVNGNLNSRNVLGHGYSAKTIEGVESIDERELPTHLIVSILRWTAQTHGAQGGAVVVFLPGWPSIQSLLWVLRQETDITAVFDLMPLHSQVPPEDQQRVFQKPPPGRRKCILSTNIAETSLTIEDAVFIIDTCKCKLKAFHSERQMSSLDVSWAGKSNCKQRRGRCGRVQDGYCFHLITRARYEQLPEHIMPEMMRCEMMEPILAVLRLRLGNPRFVLQSCIDPPPPQAVENALRRLLTMRAVEGNTGQLSDIGVFLADVPADPPVGLSIIYSLILGVFDKAVTIASILCQGDPSFLSVQDRELPARNAELDPENAMFGFAARDVSDHAHLVEVFDQWERLYTSYGPGRASEFAWRSGYNNRSLLGVHHTRRQLVDFVYRKAPALASTATQAPASKQWQLLTACLAAALSPKFALHDTGKQAWVQLTERAKIDRASRLSPLFKDTREPIAHMEYLVYFERYARGGAKGSIIRQCSVVDPVTIIAFSVCYDLVYDREAKQALFERWMPIRVTEALGILLGTGVRTAIDNAMDIYAQASHPLFALNGRGLELSALGYIEEVRKLLCEIMDGVSVHFGKRDRDGNMLSKRVPLLMACVMMAAITGSAVMLSRIIFNVVFIVTLTVAQSRGHWLLDKFLAEGNCDADSGLGLTNPLWWDEVHTFVNGTELPFHSTSLDVLIDRAVHLLVEIMIPYGIPDPAIALECPLGTSSLLHVFAELLLAADEEAFGSRSLRVIHLAKLLYFHRFGDLGDAIEITRWPMELGRLVGLARDLRSAEAGHWLAKLGGGRSPSPSSVVIVSFGHYPHNNTQLPQLSKSNKEAYAKLRGYSIDHHLVPLIPNAHAWRNKLEAIRRRLQEDSGFEWVMWVDCDAFFMDPDERVEAFVGRWATDEDHLLISEDANMLNSAVFLLRNSQWSRTLLRRVLNLLDAPSPFSYRDNQYHEQSPLQYLLLVPGILNLSDSSTGYAPGVRLVPQKSLNAYPKETALKSPIMVHDAYEHGDWIVSFNGCGSLLVMGNPTCERMLMEYHEISMTNLS